MNIPLDENSRTGAAAVLNTDPTQIQPIKADPATHALLVVSGSGQADNGNHDGNAVIDENGRAAWYGLASDASGERVIIYANSSGKLLVEFT